MKQHIESHTNLYNAIFRLICWPLMPLSLLWYLADLFYVGLAAPYLYAYELTSGAFSSALVGTLIHVAILFFTFMLALFYFWGESHDGISLFPKNVLYVEGE